MDNTEVSKDSILITCQDCGEQFEFPKREQEFFEEKGWPLPIRCKTCQKKRAKIRESYKNTN